MNTTSLPALPADPAGPTLLATRLGYAGLIPFVLGALLIWLVYPYPDAHSFVTLALAGYGATVLAFLGGIHWGLVMRAQSPPVAAPPHALQWGVVPPLLGTLVVVMPPYAGLPLLGMALVGCYLMDRKLYMQLHASHWLTLRFRLTAVAAFCSFLGAAGT